MDSAGDVLEMTEFAAVRRVHTAHTAGPRNLAGRFPVQFLIFVLSQKPAGAALHGLSGHRPDAGRSKALLFRNIRSACAVAIPLPCG
jgi:hypothetical protein